MTPEIHAACERVIAATEDDALYFLCEDGAEIARACLAQEAELDLSRESERHLCGMLESIATMVAGDGKKPEPEEVQGAVKFKFDAQQEEIARLTALVSSASREASALVDAAREASDEQLRTVLSQREAYSSKAHALTPAESIQLGRDKTGIDVFLTTEQPIAEGDGMHPIEVTSDKLRVLDGVILLYPDKCTPAERKALLSQARKTEE